MLQFICHSLKTELSWRRQLVTVQGYTDWPVTTICSCVKNRLCARAAEKYVGYTVHYTPRQTPPVEYLRTRILRTDRQLKSSLGGRKTTDWQELAGHQVNVDCSVGWSEAADRLFPDQLQHDLIILGELKEICSTVNAKKCWSRKWKGSRWPSHCEISWPAGSRDIWGKAQLHPNFGQRWIKEISGSQKLSFFANGFQKFKTNQGMVRAR